MAKQGAKILQTHCSPFTHFFPRTQFWRQNWISFLRREFCCRKVKISFCQTPTVGAFPLNRNLEKIDLSISYYKCMCIAALINIPILVPRSMYICIIHTQGCTYVLKGTSISREDKDDRRKYFIASNLLVLLIKILPTYFKWPRTWTASW
jgi:hypothetical protein